MSRYRVLLLGASGQLGTELKSVFSPEQYEVTALTRVQADLSQPEQLRKIVSGLEPEIILNAAAYTAVDKAETEPELAALVNAQCPRILAEESRKYGGLLVHYSTDYVFDGSKDLPWMEDDPTGPLNVYGRTKLEGEKAIAAVGGRHLILRTSWVFAPHGKNFLLTILRLARERERLTIVADQHGAPTSAHAIAVATSKVIASVFSEAADKSPLWPGTYHMTCAESTTWHGFAQAIVDEAAQAGLLGGRLPIVDPIPSTQYPVPAKRPTNSMLDNQKLLRNFHLALPAWRDALTEAVQRLR